jgi:hypothetical protein
VGCFDLQAVLPTATAHISNCSYETKHFTPNCTVCDLQVEAMSDVNCYLGHEMGETNIYIEILYHGYCSTVGGGSFC